MQGELTKRAGNILKCVEQIKLYEKQLLNKSTDKIKLNHAIKFLLEKIEQEETAIYNLVKIVQIKKPEIDAIPLPKPQIVLPKPRELPKGITLPEPEETPVIKIESETYRSLTKKEKENFIKELNIDYTQLDSFVEKQTRKNMQKLQIKKEDYTIYKPNSLGQFANKHFKKYADRVIEKYPTFFDPMFKRFTMVEMEILSRSYVSIMLLFTLISIPAIPLLIFILNLAFKFNIILVILFSILGIIMTFFGFYFYPASLIGEKKDKIKLELPFALVHMSAVAGSGAQPLSIFELIAESDEYPELRKEIKKILNYVNLFGYNLTNALKKVSLSTPSPELRDLLEGMISTVETGGDTKDYLKEKSSDALNTYKLDRRKQVDALATYSEVYTSLLIAAPLLLMVTLAIMNAITGKIGGFDIKLLAWIGTIVVMPLLNIGFMLFINSSQKGT